MYDELARAQRPGSLERFVVNALIPSVVLTFALHEPAATNAGVTPPLAPFSNPSFVLIDGVKGEPIIEGPEWPIIPDVFPVLTSMPHIAYPPKASAVFTALVTANGRVDRASIHVLYVSDSRLITPARRALLAARFRPAWLDGKRIPAWITMKVTS